METSHTLLYDPDAERAVLGICLCWEEGLLLVADLLEAHHFYDESHRKVWQCIRKIYAQNQAPDAILVSSMIKQQGDSDNLAHLPLHLSAEVATWRSVRSYAEVILEFYRRRELRRLSQEAQGGVETTDFKTVFERINKGLVELQIHDPSGFTDLPTLARQAKDEILLTASSAHPPGLPTGIPPLDVYLSGLLPQELVLVAARPSVGKTAVLVFIANHLARLGKRVAFFSLEMSALSLTYRLIALETGYSYVSLQTGRLDEPARLKLEEYLQTSSALPLYIDDSGGLSLFELRMRLARLYNAHPLDAVFVDYLGLLSYPGEKSREQEVARISRGLKALAKEFRLPVLAAVQLNRQSEARANKEPTLSDLRDSGSQEQDADRVILLHSPWRSGELQASQDDLSLFVAKNRNGPTGRVSVALHAPNGKIWV